MDKENKNFSDVLTDAKKLGYAESNPLSDLNGDDVAAKLKILSSLCFNSFIDHNIHVEGINFIDKLDIDNANQLGYKITAAFLVVKSTFKTIPRASCCVSSNLSTYILHMSV